MNSNEVSVFKANNLVSWLSFAAKKISAAFATKKETPVVNNDLTEAIRAIEWRTKYDQQRIVRYIYTASFQKDNPELYRALNMNLPVKHFWSDEKVNIEITENSFERKLIRFFGNLNPTTKQLIDGVETKHQRWLKKNSRVMELYLDRIPEMLGSKSKSLNGYEQMLCPLTEATIVFRIPTAQVLQLAPVALAKPEEIIINVVAETLPIEETVALNTTPLTDVEFKKLRLAMTGKTSINQLKLPDLKLYAKARRIHVPGNKTRIKAIKEIVAAAQRGSTKLFAI